MELRRLLARLLHWCAGWPGLTFWMRLRLHKWPEQLDPDHYDHWGHQHFVCMFAHVRCPVCGGSVCMEIRQEAW